MNTEKAMYIETNKLNDLFVKTDRLSTSVDSLSTLTEETLTDILTNIIEDGTFRDQWVIDLLYNHINTKIISKAVLVDGYGEGLYLVREDKKSKITIPGGHVSYEDYTNWDRTKPITSIIENALCRELLEEFNSDDLYESFLIDNNLTIDFVLRALGFNPLQVMHSYYLYSVELNTLTIYTHIMVSDILMGFANRYTEYLERYEFINHSKYDRLQDVYYNGIDNDIRFNEYSFILDVIFNTDIF